VAPFPAPCRHIDCKVPAGRVLGGASGPSVFPITITEILLIVYSGEGDILGTSI
jgi:hypothetical protein